MANVKFLRGVQSGLPTGNSIVDGALYVTTDTKRLFMGYNNGSSLSLLPLAEGIQVVTEVTELPDANLHNGEFYFISTSKILAWSDGTSWLQTNRNTTLATGQSNTVHAVSAAGAVTTTVRDSDGTQATGSFTIASGSNNVTITGDASNRIISIAVDTPTTYEFKSEGGASDNTNDDIALVLDPSTGNDQKVALKNSSSVTVKRTAGSNSNPDEISFEINPNGVGGINTVQFINGTGTITNGAPASTNGFTHEIVLSNTQKKYAQVDPTITYGQSGSQTVHFVSGVATLDVLTRTEVNAAISNLERTINAMVYRGTVSGASDMPSTVTAGGAYHNGDVYLADAEFTIGSGNDAQSVKPGYLIVIQGTEGSDGSIPANSVTYEVITGNSTDTTYQVVTVLHGIDVRSGNSVVGEIKLTEGTDINLTDTTSATAAAVSGTTNVNSIQVKHANVGRTDTHAPAANASYDDRGSETATQTARQDLTFMVVDEITTSATGHVTAVNYKKVTVTDSTLNIGAFATTSTVTTSNGTTTAQVKMESSGTDKLALQFKLASTGSIQITGSGDTTTIDIVWGTFGTQS